MIKLIHPKEAPACESENAREALTRNDEGVRGD